MADRTKNDANPTALLAKPVRNYLRAIIKVKLQTLEERKKFAKFAGLTPGFVNQMIYRGVGGLDAWIAALIYCFKIDEKVIQNFMKSLEVNVRKTAETKKSDKIWYELDFLREDEKIYWISMLKALIFAHKNFQKSK